MIVKDLAHKKRQWRASSMRSTPTPPATWTTWPSRSSRSGAPSSTSPRAHPTPFYLFDEQGFAQALDAFASAFGQHIAGHRPFYAVKSNHHPRVVEAAVRRGFGLERLQRQGARASPGGRAVPDSSSAAPAKSVADLELALAHADRTVVNLDSFRELERLGELTREHGRTIRAACACSPITTAPGPSSASPSPISRASGRAARAHPGVALEGIQFHLSWNRDAQPYQAIIADLAGTLARDFTAEERAGVAFVDVGGGYRPHRLEGYFPGDHPLGALIQAADAHYGEESAFVDPFYVKPLDPAARLRSSDRRGHRSPPPPAALRRVLQRARARRLHVRHAHRAPGGGQEERDLVIVDGGINMVGWERYLATYCPVVNLSRPAPREIRVRIGGSLCDCEDLWGFQLYGEGVEEGDLLIVPFQGAYSFSTAQEFIRPHPGGGRHLNVRTRRGPRGGGGAGRSDPGRRARRAARGRRGGRARLAPPRRRVGPWSLQTSRS